MRETTMRDADLRQMLNGRKREIEDDVQTHIREVRTDGAHRLGDDLEHSDAQVHDDIEFALIQMKSDTLRRIDEALIRLDAGKYGLCFECDDEISERRLRALPFAVRCKACEETRELERAHVRQFAERTGGLSLFSSLGSS